jgi:hypothetical protein
MPLCFIGENGDESIFLKLMVGSVPAKGFKGIQPPSFGAGGWG